MVSGVYVDFEHSALPTVHSSGISTILNVGCERERDVIQQFDVFYVLALSALEGRGQGAPLPILEYSHRGRRPSVETRQGFCDFAETLATAEHEEIRVFERHFQ